MRLSTAALRGSHNEAIYRGDGILITSSCPNVTEPRYSTRTTQSTSACELLGTDEDDPGSIVRTHRDLLSLGWKRWPEHLVAFATNGCGDFFAYDTRDEPYRVYYVGPIGSAAEQVAACEEEGFVFAGFDDWYAYVMEPRQRSELPKQRSRSKDGTPLRVKALEAPTMRLSRVRFTVRRTMLLIASFGMSLALSRVTPILGITAAVVLTLAFLRSFEVIDRLHALDRLTTTVQSLRIFLSSHLCRHGHLRWLPFPVPAGLFARVRVSPNFLWRTACQRDHDANLRGRGCGAIVRLIIATSALVMRSRFR